MNPACLTHRTHDRAAGRGNRPSSKRTRAARLATLLFPAAAFCGPLSYAVTQATAAGVPDDLPPPAVQVAVPAPVVQLAICLDTSGSMDGLIDAARQKLWAIVNDLALARPTPRLEVALLTFGNDGHDPAAGWVKLDIPFTEDLDQVSQQLFALTTNGGTEYVGRVLKAAVESLAWSPDPTSLKMIVVAGNEGADQDPEIAAPDAAKSAIEHGVLVNSVFCGSAADPIALRWQEVAKCADGQFACIDQEHGTVVIESPFDVDLSHLNDALNATYLWFGAEAESCAANQVLQDGNAGAANPAALAGRAQAKASKLYWCRADLLDALDRQMVKLEELKEEDLPEALRGKTAAERTGILEQHRAERAKVQVRIAELSKERDAFVAVEMSKLSLVGQDAFDAVVRTAIRAQARSKGLAFADEEGVPSCEERATEQAPKIVDVKSGEAPRSGGE